MTAPDGAKRTLRAKNVLVATGGEATRLDIPGAEHCVTSDEALALENLPNKSVLIVGSGCVSMPCLLLSFLLGQTLRTYLLVPLLVLTHVEPLNAARLTPHPPSPSTPPYTTQSPLNHHSITTQHQHQSPTSYIAVEFAGIFNGLGCDVHLAFRANAPLRG